MKNIEAIVFDMDGVLLDTETICDRTWEMAAKAMGIDFSLDIINECRGTNVHDTSLILKNRLGQDFNVEAFLKLSSEYFHKIEAEEGLPLMKYAKEILEYLKPKYHLILASSTRGESVKRQLKNAGLINYFESLTTGDMVTHSKPDPEIYSLACQSLGVSPECCVAVEDSPNGIRSAHAAGLNVIMVPDKIQPTEEIRGKCWQIFDSLAGLQQVL